ncbi:MAG: hypothetical protein JWM74_2505, partial [Myxococcaceae bacterium]|nr:hypothetical protein [Myxococcaceae bacterium]
EWRDLRDDHPQPVVGVVTVDQGASRDIVSSVGEAVSYMDREVQFFKHG